MAIATAEPRIRSYTLDLENKGLMIARPGDMIPPGFFSLFTNLTANKSGFVESRRGSVRVNASALPSHVHSQGRIIINGTAYIYRGAGSILYRAFSEIASGFSGEILTLRNGGPDQAIKPHMIAFDSLKRVKDDASTVTNFGIAGPMAMASAVSTSVTTKTIDDFEYANNAAIQAAWSATDSNVTTSTNNPAVGTHCANLAVLASLQGYIDKTQTIDLSGFSVSGDSTDNDYIVIYVRCDIPANLTHIKVYFDVDPTTNDFAHNYYVAEISPVELPSGTFQWKQFFIRKGSFTRVGTSSNNWANVKKIRLEAQTNVAGAVNVGFDMFEMSTGENLNGTDYEWIYRYYSETTGSVSPFSPPMTTPVEVDHANAVVTCRNPRDTQATHIELFRRGGDNDEYRFSVRAVVTAWTGTVPITDSIADADQGETVSTDQVEMTNLLVTPSQPATKVLKTTNNGSTYTDYTTAVSDDNQSTYADLSALGTLADGDYILVGADQQFRQILIDTIVGAVNLNASSLAVHYWNGTEWRSVLGMSDGTSVSGRTFGQDGTIEFDFPNDWEKATLGSTQAYYIRLTVSATLSSPVHVPEVRVGANAFDPTVCELHDGRLWADDSTHTDRLWFSERFKIEEFLEDNYVVVGSSGDPLVRPYALDDQIFAFTRKTIQRIIGSSPDSFQPISTGSETGLFSKSAICKGRGRIFLRGYDGIYSMPGSGFTEKISKDIDPIFHGIAGGAEAELQPIDHDFASTEVLEFFGGKVYFGYTATNGNRYELQLDLDAPTPRWEQTNRQVTSYLPIEDENKLYEGVATDGFVYQIDSGNVDHTSGIHLRFRTPYLDFGAPSQTKQITEIVIDCNLGGTTLNFYADLDNGEGSVQTVARTNSVRGPVHFPLADDTQARNVALRLDSSNNGVSVKFYKITFFYIDLPTPLTKVPTDWDDLGYPGDKRLRQLQLEIDTRGENVSVAVQVDGETTETLTVNTEIHEIVPLSLAADTIGKLVRLIITGSTSFRYYDHKFEFVPDPLQMTRYDTIDLDFGYTRYKFIRRVWVAANTPATVTMEIFVDQVSKFSTTFTIESSSGWKKQRIKLPAGLKGMVFRFVFTSSSRFKIFLDQSDVEWHPLAGNRGYERAQLAQPTG